MVNLDRYVGSWNTPDDVSDRVWVPNKTEDLDINVFNTSTGLN